MKSLVCTENDTIHPPASSYGLNGTKGDLATYSGYIFPARAVDLIKRHAAEAAAEGAVESPLFMFLSLHNTHAPVEAPQRFIGVFLVDLIDCLIGFLTSFFMGNGYRIFF